MRSRPRPDVFGSHRRNTRTPAAPSTTRWFCTSCSPPREARQPAMNEDATAMNEDEQPATATPFSGVVAMFRKSLDLGLSKLNKKTKMLGGWGTLKPMKQADLKKKSATNYKKGFKQTKGIKVKGQKEGERNIFHRAAPHPHPQRPHSLLPLPSLADGSTNKKAGSTPVSKGTLSRTRTRTRARARERAHAHAHARRICSSILGWPSSSGRKHSTCTRTNAQLAPPNHTPLASTACAHIQYTATPTQIPRVPARRPRRARQLLRAGYGGGNGGHSAKEEGS